MTTTQQQRFKPVAVDELQVLAILRESDRPQSWSAIACQIHGVQKASLEQTRGVRDACRALEEKGLAREIPRRPEQRLPTLLFEAVE